MNKKVFISYSSEDKPFAEWLTKNLRENQIDIWYDASEIKAGDSIKEKIQEGIEASSTIIIVFSRNSITSDWVRFEYNSALAFNSAKKGINIIPVIIENVKIPFPIGGILYVDMTADKHAGLIRLINAIKSSPDISYSNLDWEKLSAKAFEDLVYELMAKEGFELSKMPKMRDGGFDFIGRIKNAFGAEERVIVECKLYKNSKISIDTIRWLYSMQVSEKVGRIFLVTNSRLTKSSQEFIASLGGIFVVWEEQVLFNKLRLYPGLIEKYFSIKPILSPKPVKLIDDAFLEMQKLIHELDTCPEGKRGWKQYENICTRILKHLFSPPLGEPKIQSRTESGIDIRDAVFPNRSKNENWKFIRDDYDAKYIVFEFKNHSEEGDNVDKQSVMQISDYLKTTIGKFGIICSNKQPVNSGLEKRKDVFINQGKLIIFITNEHLKEMLMRKYMKQDPADIIIDLIDKFNLDF